MRLLQDEGDGHLILVEYHDDGIPPYAILSHTWGAGLTATKGREATQNGHVHATDVVEIPVT